MLCGFRGCLFFCSFGAGPPVMRRSSVTGLCANLLASSSVFFSSSALPGALPGPRSRGQGMSVRLKVLFCVDLAHCRDPVLGNTCFDCLFSERFVFVRRSICLFFRFPEPVFLCRAHACIFVRLYGGSVSHIRSHAML